MDNRETTEALQIARKALYELSTMTEWRPIGGSIAAAMAHHARTALGLVDQIEANSETGPLTEPGER